jgi:predicted amidohydrolase
MRIAVCQLNPREDRAANLAAARAALGDAAARGADLAVLPEMVDYTGPGTGAPKPEPVDGEFGTFMAAAARELGISGSRRLVPRGGARPGARVQHLTGLRSQR